QTQLNELPLFDRPFHFQAVEYPILVDQFLVVVGDYFLQIGSIVVDKKMSFPTLLLPPDHLQILALFVDSQKQLKNLMKIVQEIGWHVYPSASSPGSSPSFVSFWSSLSSV